MGLSFGILKYFPDQPFEFSVRDFDRFTELVGCGRKHNGIVGALDELPERLHLDIGNSGYGIFPVALDSRMVYHEPSGQLVFQNINALVFGAFHEDGRRDQCPADRPDRAVPVDSRLVLYGDEYFMSQAAD